MMDTPKIIKELRDQLARVTTQISTALERKAALEQAIEAMEALDATDPCLLQRRMAIHDDDTPDPCPSPAVSSSSSSSPKKEKRRKKKEKRGEGGSTQPGTQQGAVLEALCSLGGAGRPVELQRITGLPRTRVATSLTRLGREGLVSRESRGVYLPTEAGRVWVSRHRTGEAAPAPTPIPRRAPTPVPGGPRKKERWDGVERGARVVLEDTPAPHVAVAIGTVQYGQGGYALELNGKLVRKADGVTPEWWPGLGEVSRAVRRLLRERGEEVAA